MKIFSDTGDVESRKRAHDTGLLDGVTTNPTHIAKTGRKFQQVVQEICAIVDGPVSVEAMGESTQALVQAAETTAKNELPSTSRTQNSAPVDACVFTEVIRGGLNGPGVSVHSVMGKWPSPVSLHC